MSIFTSPNFPKHNAYCRPWWCCGVFSPTTDAERVVDPAAADVLCTAQLYADSSDLQTETQTTQHILSTATETII